MELTGKIIAVLPAAQGVSQRTGNPWMSQEYVDRIKQFNIQSGEELTVSFDIDAHEYNGRWFNEIRAYNVSRMAPGVVPAAPTMAPVAGVQPAAPVVNAAPEANTADDLPF